MNFHKRLRDLIEENDITQKKLAADLNIAASTVSSYVQGVREPDFSILLRLADYFHVSTDYLLGLSDNVSLDISHLTEKEIQLVYNLVQYFRNKD